MANPCRHRISSPEIRTTLLDGSKQVGEQAAQTLLDWSRGKNLSG